MFSYISLYDLVGQGHPSLVELSALVVIVLFWWQERQDGRMNERMNERTSDRTDNANT